MLQVPSLDLDLFKNGDKENRAIFSAALGEAFRTYGFAIIKNHGIHQSLIDAFYSLSQEFFHLDTELKSAYELPGMAGQRGYVSFGREHAKHSQTPDLKEFFQIGQDNPYPGADKKIYIDNVHVAEMPDFVRTGILLYKAFEKAGSQLLAAIADYLNLPTDYFSQKISGGNSILRTIYYPPILTEPKSAVRAESHEDINLITLLVGASAGGLELLTSTGEWLEVKPKEDEIAINVGDMLQRLTNNFLPSTTHRVTNPPRDKWSEERLSIPFFLHPRPEMDLTCLASCVTDSNPEAYSPINSHDYLTLRLKEIGLGK